jgi:hypothetical protein
MANTDLLKEAIADAKSVKETAIANAKLALEEAFTPHLKSMLSAKLEEMDKDEEVNEEEEVVEKKEEDEIDLDELLAELELDENARTDAEEEGYKDGIKDEKEDLKEDDRTDAEEEGYEDGMKDEKEDEEDGIEDEEIDLEDMSEDDLKGFIEDVIKDLVTDGTIEAGEEFEDEEVVDVEDVDDIDVEVEIDEVTKKEEAEGDDRKKDDKEEAETEKMRFKEAIDEINALKSELNEVNLLNAKLLYTNKIFKSKNLSEDKKIKVLKAFDKASTVKEAKVVFETLNEGMVSNSRSTHTPSINEIKGRASKATGVKPKAKQPIMESNAVYDRMRKLAGLI